MRGGYCRATAGLKVTASQRQNGFQEGLLRLFVLVSRYVDFHLKAGYSRDEQEDMMVALC